MPAVGVTDTANLFGALEFSEKAAEKGIQPIIGCKLPVRFEPEPEFEARRSGPERPSRHVAPLFLLAATDEGYRGADQARHRLLSRRSGRRRTGCPRRARAGIGGLIALTGGHDGPLYPVLAAGDVVAGRGAARGAEAASSATASTSRRAARHGDRAAGRGGGHRPRLSRSIFRSSPPTSRSFRPPTTTRRMTRCLPSRRGGCCRATTAGG